MCLKVVDTRPRVINPERPLPNYIVAVKHPAEMLLRLLFKPHETARVYLSYSITETRGYEQRRRIIDDFRKRMHEQQNCAAFDPLTIDELPPVARISDHSDAHTLFDYDGSLPRDRWPLHNPDKVLAPDNDVRYPIQIPFEELREVCDAIDAQVKTRDIRLVDQAHYLIVYRPTLAGTPKLGSGVQGEVDHASETRCPTIWYIKKGEDPLPKSPFVPKNPSQDPDFFYEPTEERFWARIQSLHNEIDRRRDSFLG